MNARKVMQALLDGKKVRAAQWASDEYIQLICGHIRHSEGHRLSPNFHSGDWEIYPESKNLKRFWIWAISEGGLWHKTSFYIDNDGNNTIGNKEFSDWNDIPKQRLEDEFIDIEWEG